MLNGMEGRMERVFMNITTRQADSNQYTVCQVRREPFELRLEWTLQVDVYIYMIIHLFANTASSLDPVCKCNPELVYGLSPDL